ncbi:MAG: hypothetical protein H6668_09280 [Ardenticatenaceae bacterium]|nr:hypothetical protein [Ardenticatenaceae bacterium]
MSTALQITVPQKALLAAVGALDVDELDHFLDEVLRLRAQRIAPSIPSSEIALVDRIHAATLDANERARLQDLSERLELDTLRNAELVELQALADKAEALNVERMQAVGELALMRGQTLDAVLRDLGMLYTDGA